VAQAEPTYYQAFPELSGTYLEDSWVLSVSVENEEVTFDLDLVLTPEDPSYHPPQRGEQHCYVRASLVISSPEGLTFNRSEAPPAVDASGEKDFGNIDSFTNVGEDRWQIEGCWGTLEVCSPQVTVLRHP
jgi:hypothetical protein